MLFSVHANFSLAFHSSIEIVFFLKTCFYQQPTTEPRSLLQIKIELPHRQTADSGPNFQHTYRPTQTIYFVIKKGHSFPRAAQMTEDKEGEMSRSIKLPQTIDLALRNIRDAKVNITFKRDAW